MNKLEELIKEYCPDGVEYKELSEFLKIKNGSDYKELGMGDIPVYGSGGIMTYVDKAAYDKPSVLIPRKGSIDKLYYVDTPFWNVDTIFYTEIDITKAIPRYVYHCLLREHLEQYNTAGGVPSLTQKVLNKVKIPLPPLEVQREIVKILDNFTLLTAELTAELTARRKQYEYYRDKLLSFNVHGGGAGDVEWRTLKEIAEIGTGSRNTNEAVENGVYPFFVRSQEPLALNEYEYDEIAIITAGDGVGVGKVYHYVDGKYALHQRAYRIHITADNVLPRYYFHYMRTKFLPYIEKNMFHSSVSSIRRPMLNEFPVPIPSLEVQKRLITILDNFEKICSNLSIGLPAEIEARQKQYEYYRDALLSFNSSYFVNVERERERDEWRSGLIRLWQYVFGYTKIKISDVGKICMCKRIMKSETSDQGDIPFYKIGTFGGLANAYISRETFEKYKSMYSYPKKGDILISAAGTIGRTVIYNGEPAYYQDSNIVWVDNNEKIVLNKFLYYCYQLNPWTVSTGGTIARLYNDNLANAAICVPSIAEQAKIVSILDRFKSLCNDISEGLPAEIAARQKQYEYYRNKLLTFKEI